MFVIGQKFNRYTVLSLSNKKKDRSLCYLCRCECGTEKVICGSHLRNGRVKSCGCLNKDVQRKRNTKHGMHLTSEYRAWATMIQRCTNPKSINYHRYGGRGITIEPLFLSSFEEFIKEVGKKTSPDLTLDRLDNNKGYIKGNLRWVTKSENIRNRNKMANKTSKYIGVSYAKRDKRWVACLFYNGKLHRIGSFESELEAALSYDKKYKEIYNTTINIK